MTTVQWLGRDSNANKAGYTAIQSRRLGRSNNAKTIWNSEMLPGDQPELRKCIISLHLNYMRKLVGDGLGLKRIGERLLI